MKKTVLALLAAAAMTVSAAHAADSMKKDTMMSDEMHMKSESGHQNDMGMKDTMQKDGMGMKDTMQKDGMGMKDGMSKETMHH